ncbi:MAG TPA: hypothetical protein VF412_12355 [Bdellovibrio sp.]|uniref:hypothetical protein n=1 Tax=Bdellovibrio sp. TaxID=28201 RepID=UPI002EE45951
MMKKLILTVALLGLASCAYDQDKSGSSAQTKRLQEQNAQVQQNFSKIAGVYSGILKTVTGDEKIQINLSILAQDAGTQNSDGTEVIRYVQSATYIKINPLGAPLVNFSVSYIPETGDITLVNQTKSTDIDEVHTVFARIVNGHMTGTVRSTAGIRGTLNLDLSANQTANPPNGAQEEYNERRRQQFAALAGSYVGCVLPTDDGSVKAGYTVSMSLSLYEDGTDESNTVPRLAGSFHRDYDTTGGLDAALSATYRPDLTPATLNIVGKPFIATTGYVSTFQGTYADGSYTGTFTSTKKGLEGSIFLQKGKAYPTQCADLVK